MDANTLADMLRDGRAKILYSDDDGPEKVVISVGIISPRAKTVGEKIIAEWLSFYPGAIAAGSATYDLEKRIDKAVADEREACACILEVADRFETREEVVRRVRARNPQRRKSPLHTIR